MHTSRAKVYPAKELEHGLRPNNQINQLLAHGRWFFPGTVASSTTKTGRHDIAEISLKLALKHQKSINQSIKSYCLSTGHDL
jgi:hypothetical protein